MNWNLWLETPFEGLQILGLERGGCISELAFLISHPSQHFPPFVSSPSLLQLPFAGPQREGKCSFVLKQNCFPHTQALLAHLLNHSASYPKYNALPDMNPVEYTFLHLIIQEF